MHTCRCDTISIINDNSFGYIAIFSYVVIIVSYLASATVLLEDIVHTCSFLAGERI